ncbi:DciA family protein [Streptomyces sp. NPDC058297]|uniref:DciA family protein n=1 Tax=Streptomyces sp. NPDC058297 TaxID=3346433 RepID=UPI0036F03356
MTSTPPASGIDLARQALANYKATAASSPARGTRSGPTPGRRRMRPGDGRDPVGLAAVIKQLGTDASWKTGIDGGSVIDRWTDLCPQYATAVQPVAYDADRGRLDLRPATQAYAAQLRLLGGQLAKQINDKMGRDVVRSILVLPVGAVTPARPPAGTPAASPAPVENPEPTPAAIAEPVRLIETPTLSRAEAVRRAAIARKRAESNAPVRRAFDVA